MHYLDANKTAGEEARRQLHKNVESNIEQVLAATPHKAPTIRPPASHHENYLSRRKMNHWITEYWTSLGGNTPQDTNYTDTSLPSRKLSKSDEPDTQDTGGEAETSS